MNEIVFRGANDQAVTSSLLIAEKFGKDKIVVAMLLQQAQDIVMNNADITEN